jgi:hypothetical protein
MAKAEIEHKAVRLPSEPDKTDIVKQKRIKIL